MLSGPEGILRLAWENFQHVLVNPYLMQRLVEMFPDIPHKTFFLEPFPTDLSVIGRKNDALGRIGVGIPRIKRAVDFSISSPEDRLSCHEAIDEICRVVQGLITSPQPLAIIQRSGATIMLGDEVLKELPYGSDEKSNLIFWNRNSISSFRIVDLERNGLTNIGTYSLDSFPKILKVVIITSQLLNRISFEERGKKVIFLIDTRNWLANRDLSPSLSVIANMIMRLHGLEVLMPNDNSIAPGVAKNAIYEAYLRSHGQES